MNTSIHPTAGDGFRPAGGPPQPVSDADAEAVSRGWTDAGFYRLAMADLEIGDAAVANQSGIVKHLWKGGAVPMNGSRAYAPELPPPVTDPSVS